MSDSSNSFGEALESMTTNTKKAIGGTIADFTKSATNQVKGTGGVSGSFTPGQSNPPTGGQNPNIAPGLTGGDLFSPDMKGGQKPTQNPAPKPLTQVGQQAAASNDVKSPEEIAKIQSIEAELKSMHQQYYQDFLAKAEGRDRKKQVEEQQKVQDDQQQQMDDLQKDEKKKQEASDLFRAKRSSEIKGGLG